MQREDDTEFAIAHRLKLYHVRAVACLPLRVRVRVRARLRVRARVRMRSRARARARLFACASASASASSCQEEHLKDQSNCRWHPLFNAP